MGEQRTPLRLELKSSPIGTMLVAKRAGPVLPPERRRLRVRHLRQPLRDWHTLALAGSVEVCASFGGDELSRSKRHRYFLESNMRRLCTRSCVPSMPLGEIYVRAGI